MLVLGTEIFRYHCHFGACVLVTCFGRLLSFVCIEDIPLALDFVDFFVAVVALVIAFDALLVGDISIVALVGCWMKRVLSTHSLLFPQAAFK